MKKISPVSMFFTLAMVAGCGGSGGNGGGGADASVDLADSTDMTSSFDLQPSTVPGSRIVAGEVALDGVTTDDNAIIEDPKKGLLAVALGKMQPMPQAIDATPDAVYVSGKVVFSFTTVDMTINVGALTAWSAATGGAKKLSTASVNGVVGSSADGAAIAFSDKASSDGNVADLILAKADGTGRVTLAAGVNSGLDGTCQPFLEFAGGKLFFTYCAGVVPDGGPSGATIAFADVGTGKITTLATNAADTFSVDKAGGRVLVIDLAGQASVVSTSGKPALPIDTTVAAAELSADGNTLLYLTSAGALKRASVSTTPNPVVLVAKNANVIEAVSPDEKWVQLSNQVDNNTSLSDLFLASATTAGVPVTLNANLTTNLLGIDPFTADSGHALFFSDIASNNSATLSTVAVSGGKPTILGTSAWNAYAAKGSTVVFNDHFKSVPMKRGRADLFTVDVARADPPSLLVLGAGADFFLTSAKDRVVFTVSGGTGAGLYLLSL